VSLSQVFAVTGWVNFLRVNLSGLEYEVRGRRGSRRIGTLVAVTHL
jgi:hypothetical protein